MIDLSKYPLEKLSHFAASIIPGFVVLLLIEAASPGRIARFFALPFLGYRTKVSLILLAVFVVGISMTTFLSSLLGAIGGAMGGAMARRPFQPAHTYPTAPWRDHRWRVLLKSRLGAQAPNDTIPIMPETFNLRVKMIESAPTELREKAMQELLAESLASQMDDGKWMMWYEHFHGLILQRPNPDFASYVQTGLIYNLQVASIGLLLGAIAVPAVRHWWYILPALGWVLILSCQQYTGVNRVVNKWSTLGEQIEYLSAGSFEHGTLALPSPDAAKQ